MFHFLKSKTDIIFALTAGFLLVLLNWFDLDWKIIGATAAVVSAYLNIRLQHSQVGFFWMLGSLHVFALSVLTSVWWQRNSGLWELTPNQEFIHESYFQVLMLPFGIPFLISNTARHNLCPPDYSTGWIFWATFLAMGALQVCTLQWLHKRHGKFEVRFRYLQVLIPLCVAPYLFYSNYAQLTEEKQAAEQREQYELALKQHWNESEEKRRSAPPLERYVYFYKDGLVETDPDKSRKYFWAVPGSKKGKEFSVDVPRDITTIEVRYTVDGKAAKESIVLEEIEWAPRYKWFEQTDLKYLWGYRYREDRGQWDIGFNLKKPFGIDHYEVGSERYSSLRDFRSKNTVYVREHGQPGVWRTIGEFGVNPVAVSSRKVYVYRIKRNLVSRVFSYTLEK